MVNCFTVGHDSCDEGISIVLSAPRPFLLVGEGENFGRRVFFTEDEGDRPHVKNGKVFEAYGAQEDRVHAPGIVLVRERSPVENPYLLVLVDTSRRSSNCSSIDFVEEIGRVSGDPQSIARWIVSHERGNFLKELFRLSPGDALLMRPFGVSPSDWTRQRIVRCVKNGEELALEIIPRNTFLRRGTRTVAALEVATTT